MREILFKGKKKDNGEWIEGYLFDDGMPAEKRMFIGKLVISPYEGTACDKWSIEGIDFDEVDPETICQYTGLTDKNGNRIWENDIICRNENGISIYAPIKFGFYGPQFSKKANGYGYYVDFSERTAFRKELGYWRDKVVVAGNVFDDLELLQEESK